jgi:hypothetical protein
LPYHGGRRFFSACALSFGPRQCVQRVRLEA